MRWRGTAVVLAGFLALAAAGPVAANAADLSIAVNGNRHIGDELIRSYFHAGPDGRLDAVRLDAALKSLYATGLFKDVKVSRQGDRALVTVVENPTIARVAIEGNKKLKDDDLKKDLESKAGGPLARPLVHNDVIHILALYRARGYFDVQVVPKTIDVKNARVDLVFEIKEGGRLAG